MQSAFDTIVNEYDYETLKEISINGYGYVGCGQHIFDDNAIKFFETYPDEVTQRIKDNLDVQVIIDNYKENDANWDAHMRDLTWMFIELVAMQVVDEREAQELEDDEVIGSYFNPPRSMSDSRYAQVWASAGIV